jgi:hypothetical protein
VIVHIFEQRILREILDGEHGTEYGLQSLVETSALRLLDLKKLVIGCSLNLDEVRHLRHFMHLAEEFAEPFASRERKSHAAAFLFRTFCPAEMGRENPTIERLMARTPTPPGAVFPEGVDVPNMYA